MKLFINNDGQLITCREVAIRKLLEFYTNPKYKTVDFVIKNCMGNLNQTQIKFLEKNFNCSITKIDLGEYYVTVTLDRCYGTDFKNYWASSISIVMFVLRNGNHNKWRGGPTLIKSILSNEEDRTISGPGRYLTALFLYIFLKVKQDAFTLRNTIGRVDATETAYGPAVYALNHLLLSSLQLHFTIDYLEDIKQYTQVLEDKVRRNIRLEGRWSYWFLQSTDTKVYMTLVQMEKLIELGNSTTPQ